MGLWSFLRGLWPSGKRRRPDPVAPAETLTEPPLGPADDAVLEAPGNELLHDLPAEPVETPVEAAAAPAPPDPPEPEPTEPQPAEPEPTRPEPLESEGAERDEDEPEDEDAGWEDEDEDLDAPDPFITGEPVDREEVDSDLEMRRAAARVEALGGEQRIYLHAPAGPGSLAEALNQLLAEGLVQAEFVDDADGEPHILYRPVERSSAEP